MNNFRQVDRETGYLLSPSVDEWLPERHLARFVVEVVDQLDLSPFAKAYRGSGSPAHHPSVLLGLLIYGYAREVYSSRKLERATYDSVAFRFVAANDHRDHDTSATFRRRFLTEIEQLFVDVLLLACQAGMLKLGTVALDGTKIHADASRHSALSWKRACEIKARLRAEVAELMALAEAANAANVPDGMSVPEELARREDRLAVIAAAKAELEARVAERHAREQDEYEEKMRAREEKAARTGRKPGGRPPAPPEAGPRPKDQINLTDPDSAIMPVAGGGFEQCYNAQATVTADSLLVVTADVVQTANDKREIEPALAALARLPEALGTPESLLAFQPGQRRGLRRRRHRAADRAGPGASPSLLAGSFRRGAARAGGSNAAGGDAPSLRHAGGPGALRAPQADPGAGVRHHQIGDRVPPVQPAQPRASQGRVEPGHPGVEHQADVRPQSRMSRARARLRSSLTSNTMTSTHAHQL